VPTRRPTARKSTGDAYWLTWSVAERSRAGCRADSVCGLWAQFSGCHFAERVCRRRTGQHEEGAAEGRRGGARLESVSGGGHYGRGALPPNVLCAFQRPLRAPARRAAPLALAQRLAPAQPRPRAQPALGQGAWARPPPRQGARAPSRRRRRRPPRPRRQRPGQGQASRPLQSRQCPFAWPALCLCYPRNVCCRMSGQRTTASSRIPTTTMGNADGVLSLAL